MVGGHAGRTRSGRRRHHDDQRDEEEGRTDRGARDAQGARPAAGAWCAGWACRSSLLAVVGSTLAALRSDTQVPGRGVHDRSRDPGAPRGAGRRDGQPAADQQRERRQRAVGPGRRRARRRERPREEGPGAGAPRRLEAERPDHPVRGRAGLGAGEAGAGRRHARTRRARASTGCRRCRGCRAARCRRRPSSTRPRPRCSARRPSSRARGRRSTRRAPALNSDRTNLSKASIRSPIDGVVLTRSVEPGQTVAASMQIATLFTIAEDLKQMELEVDVDEADVGGVARRTDGDLQRRRLPEPQVHGVGHARRATARRRARTWCPTRRCCA